jgi:hypothetical protein
MFPFEWVRPLRDYLRNRHRRTAVHADLEQKKTEGAVVKE